MGLFFLSGGALAQRPMTHQEHLPNLDRRIEVARTSAVNAARSRTNAVANLRARLPRAEVEFDGVGGGAKFVHARDGFLTGTNGQGRGISAAAARAVPVSTPHRPVKMFLHEHREIFGHGPAEVEASRVKRDYVTAHNGLRTVVWQQELDGLEVFEATVVAHTTAREELVSVSSQMLPDLDRAADRGTPNRRAQQSAPTITAAQAVALAAREVGEELDAGEVIFTDAATGAEMKQKFRANRALTGDADARLVWLPADGGKLRLCWAVIFTSQKRGEMFHTLIDAETGEARFRRCLTHYISPISLRVYTSDSPTPFSPGHPTPLTNQPPTVARQLLTLSALNTNASPNGWIDDGVNETRGNNVDAHTDLNADNIADLPRPQGSPFRVFDFPMDLAQAPSTYPSAAVAQLFYWCNWYHDKLYELGFTEAAGNFQGTNFGRGGVGNDAVQADAQDGSGTDNANFSTPPDGFPGRMQMYVFSSPTPDRDGDFDAEIVIHEYTHGLSWRLVGGGQALGTSQSDGMGEGWSDFYALALLSAAEDNVNGNYAAGGYATLQFFGLQQNYYYGIRRYPYSTDMTKNPLTFKDIDPAQAGSHTGVPRSPVIPTTADEVHNQGEVWCVTLWDARANLIAKHGWAAGNQLILQLVTDGMKLTPPQPNFLQARDAILQADLINTGGANQNELWAAFARRGMGYSATSPGSTTTTGVVESFDLPDDLRILPATGFVAVGPVGGPFNVTAQNFILTNAGAAPLNWSLASSASWLNASITNGTIAAGASATVNFSLGAAAGSLPFGIYTNTVRFTNTTSQVGQGRTFHLVAGLVDYFTELFDTTTNDLAFTTLTFTPDGSAGFYRACRDEAAVFPTDPAGGTAVSLSDDSYLPVTLTGTNTVAIHNRRTNVFFIGSNGYLTMDDGDATYAASLGAHFSLPRVAAVFDDLNPGDGGTISRRELSNRVAVTWLAVPEYGSPANTNSFQIELFFDGRIRVTWLNVNSSGSLAGLSAGQGVAIGFQESDLSAYGLCNPPLLVSLPASATEGDGVRTNAGLVRLLVPRTTNLVINLASSDPAEVTVPASVTVPAGQTNAAFDLTVMDDAEADGTQSALITATAPNHTGGSATVAVHDNETAVLAVSLPASATEGQGTVGGSVSIPFVATANITVSLFSSDPAEIQVPASVLIPAGQTSAVFAVTIVDDTRIDSAQTSTVTARVQNWTDGAASLTVLDNEPLTLTVALPGSVGEAGGTAASLGPVRLADAGAVQLAGTLPTNLVVALVSDNTNKMLVPPAVTIPAGQLSSTFDLFPVNNLLQEGNLAVSVAASAPGFTDGGAALLIVDDDLPPVIYFHPTNQSVVAGRAVSFGVTAVGGQPLSYQWRKDGTNLPAVTNAVFAISVAQTNDAGLYSVVVSNLFGFATSAGATLAVTPAAAGLADDFEPGIDLTQWAGFGGTVGLTVLATNYGGSVSPINSLWFGDAGPRSATTRAINTTNGGQLSFYLRLGANGSPWETADLPEEGIVLEFTADGAAWTEIGRYDTAVFYAWTRVAVNLAPALQGQAVQFRWRQLSHSGLGTDHWALDDVMVVVPPGITKHPTSRTVNVGAAVSFTVEATGSPPLNYQWSFNGTNLAAATNAALNLFNVTTNHAGLYAVVVTNAVGSAASSNAVLAVNIFTNQPPTLDAIASLTLAEDVPQTVPLTGIGPGGAAETNQSWILTASSSSTGVVAVARSYTFPSSTGTLTLTPAANASGTAVITVVVTDSGGTAFGGVNAKTNTFAVTVQSLNDRPTLNPMANLTINEDSGLQTVLLAGIGPGAANEAAQSLTFNAFTADPGLVTIINAGANQAAGTGWINFRPVSDAVGIATIAVVLRDDGGTENGGVDASTNTFRVTISGVNDPPTLAPIGSLGVFENSGPRIVNLTGLTAGPPDESGQTLLFSVFTAETNLLTMVATNYNSPSATGSLTF
ncbi:MAG: M36 family metallopeptidase, partial [Verrucomicrobia bacterium]|nr:M36 family metallopeptidase [Verrucomicrobiota bacterium]